MVPCSVFGPFGPMIVDRPSFPTLDHVDSPAAIEIAGHLEAARENNAVDLAFLAVGDEAAFGYALQAFGVGDVDQLHIGTAEGR